MDAGHIEGGRSAASSWRQNRSRMAKLRSFHSQRGGGGRTGDGLLPLRFSRSVTLDLENRRILLEVNRGRREGGDQPLS